MNILMVASEAAPLAHTSDVANVVSGLAIELRRKGHDMRLAIPCYRGLARDYELKCIIPSVDVSLASYSRSATIRRFDHTIDSLQLPFYLVGNSFYFERDNPYGYLDDYERFIFFGRAILAMLRHPDFAQEAWQPDVIHGHDWIAGLIPTWLREASDSGLDTCPSAFVYTLHNTGFQGCFGYRALLVAGLADRGFYPAVGESIDSINFMARGILAADAVNTVSPRHAREISAGEIAPELLRAVQARGSALRGILNGLNFRADNPAMDERIVRRFDQYSLELRAENKRALQEECGLEVDTGKPLLGVISRLIAEKGIGLVAEAASALLAQGVQMVIAGEADDQHYREVFTTLAAEFPSQIKTVFLSDDSQVRRICAGADLILTPSLHEPCGLQPMIAMRYGAVPVVRGTGGLSDTVLPFSTAGGLTAGASASGTMTGQGFVFQKFDAQSFLQSVFAALDLYRNNRLTWQELQRRNMQVDFSWARSAQAYVALYEEAMRARLARPPLLRGDTTKPDEHDRLLSTILEIDELAMSSRLEDYLQQAARSVRMLLESDATLIWLKDPVVPLRLRPMALSVAEGGGAERLMANMPPPDEWPELFSGSPQHTYHLDAEGVAGESRLGFLTSKLARAAGWQAQLSAPMSTQGVVVGQIDVFSCDQGRQFTDQEVSAQVALARTLAANVEKARLRGQRDRLLAADREMSKATQLSAMARAILSCARDLTGAVAACLALNGDVLYTLDRDDSLVAGGALQADSTITLRRRLFSSRKNSLEPEVGWIEVIKPVPGSFSREDEAALSDLAKQAADALDAAQEREAREQVRVDRLRRLAASGLGRGDFDDSLRYVVRTTAEALDVEAASLYLMDAETSRLVVRVATGRHIDLVQVGASYEIGEGITGWIAATGETVRADSSTELRARAHWRGKYITEGGFEPETFLGIPLKVIDRISGDERVVGVLKLVDKRPHPLRSPVFDDEDVYLGEMMANIIATIVYHQQVSQSQLKKLGRDLDTLATVLSGGREMQDLLTSIVETMMKVLGAEAAALFLVDDATHSVVVQAAAGYQAGLLKERASYQLGEGMTGWIAQEGKPFRAKTLAELHSHPAWRGKHNRFLGKLPNSFLGLPLLVTDRFSGVEKVIGVLKVENIAQSNEHPEPHFTDQDELLVTMMANVIATVLHNTQVGRAQLEKLSGDLNALSDALAGGREMRDVLDRVVETMMRVLGAEASSLFLVDEVTNKVVVQAAAGYQQPLVAHKATYELGEGVTGWIAKEGRAVRANTLEDLHSHPAWIGKHTLTYGREPNSYLGLPLLVTDRFTGKSKVIGVLKIENIARSPGHPESYFTNQDELLVAMMANVIATVLYNTQVSQTQLEKLSKDLDALSDAMAGGHEMKELLGRVVETIMRVLGADASALFLVDEARGKVIVQAAAGYQKPLVAARASYNLGEGITGWIAKEGRVVRARTLEELHGHPAWKGQYTQGGREPNSFLGLPLRVTDRFGGKEKVIGVLKVENIARSPSHPELYFTDQDELLVTMMANVIATALYNTQVSQAQLEKLSGDLGALSEALAGGREMRDLLDRVVETMMRVLGADASALFLVDEATNKVVVQAAAGYQKPLVARGATYDLGEGITGWIAKEGRVVLAKTLDELHRHPAWAGKQTKLQGGREPNSFLGLPLLVTDRVSGRTKVIGVLKVENIARSMNHPEPYFTDRDELLVTMMANVIATVIYNVRQGEGRIGDIVKRMGILSRPINAADDLLREFARSKDSGIIDQLAIQMVATLDNQPHAAREELEALFEAGANPELYVRIASRSSRDDLRWLFHLVSGILTLVPRPETWTQVEQVARPWLELHDKTGDSDSFAMAVRDLVVQVAATINVVEAGVSGPYVSPMWTGAVLDVGPNVSENIDRIPLVFLRTGEIDDHSIERLYSFAQNGMDRPYQALLVVAWHGQPSPVYLAHLRRWMNARAIDLILADPTQLMQIMQAANPEEELRSLVLRQATHLSPFVTVGPVPPSMFFGRERELRALVDYLAAGRSCAVIAGRRYGKTSVLQRLHGLRLPQLGFRTLYLDWQAFDSHEDILAARALDWMPEPPRGAAATLGELLKKPPVDKSLVLLIDEVDRFISADRQADWRFFRKLRTLANGGSFRVVLSGERVLREALVDSNGPLYNFVNVRLLGPLEDDAVEQLVVRPFRQLEFELEDQDEIVRRICAFTSGHPNVIQRLCRRLEELAGEQNTRSITPAAVNAVLSTPAFQETDFLATYWERATPLERIVTLLMAEEDRPYTLRMILKMLADQGMVVDPGRVKAALDRLVDLRCILKHSQAGWEFAVKAFPRVLASTTTASDLLIVLKAEYETEKL